VEAADPFGTAAIRARVLAGWAAGPARFREDANAEEDLARGAYRDRLVVELAQNAADAATRGGVPGRLLLRLEGGQLVAANTGAPLDAAGVEALSTLRASAKRDDQAAAGRFGVGFAAVLAVTDAPEMHSSTGSVRWSLADARVLTSAVPSTELAGELDRRGGHVPLLRLPLPTAAEALPLPGFDTAVLLPLRDRAAEQIARTLLTEIDAALLLALPALTEVVVEVDGTTRRLTATRVPEGAVTADAGVVTRWLVVERSGRIDPQLLADRPTEERERQHWTVTWALPVDAAGRPAPLPATTPAVVHAPTPTAEPLGFPALLLASFPLDPGRRHVAAGSLRAHVVLRVAEAYAELVARLEADPAVLRLVPGPVATGALDAEIRRAVIARLAETPFFPVADVPDVPDGPDGINAVDAVDAVHAVHARQRPRDATAVDDVGPAVVAVLAPVLSGLLPADWARQRAPLAALGVRRLPLADLIDLLAQLERPPSWWRGLYAAIAEDVPASQPAAEALGALPVPLADATLVRGPRGRLLPSADLDPALPARLGLRVIHPEAAHPLLERLGAVPAGPRSVLTDRAVRLAVAAAGEEPDDGDPGGVVDAVLGLVAAAGLTPGEELWLAELPLPDDAGELVPARELVLPGSPLAEVVVADEAPRVAVDLLERWGAGVLQAVGVPWSLALVREADVPLDPDAVGHDLDGEDEWREDVLDLLPEPADAAVVAEFVAVRDLDLVAEDAWPRALELLGEPALRPAVVEPAIVLLADGRRVDVSPYTAWWLRQHPVVDRQRPTDLRLPGDERLDGLYSEASGALPAWLTRALGVRGTLEELLAEPGGPDQLLARLADPARPVRRSQLREVYRTLAAVPPELVTPPDQVRAVVDGVVVVAAAADVVVVDAPDLLPLLGRRPLVVVPWRLASDLAEVLAAKLASSAVAGRVTSVGDELPVPAAALEMLGAGGGPSEPPATYVEHDVLLVDGWEVDWRVVEGVVHAATVDGLARGLAWAAGRWERRWAVAEALHDPSQLPELLAEADLDDR
jgi:hypothetical protein